MHRNKLLLIVDIQDITLEHKDQGRTQIWIYENIIYPQYRISKSAFYKYLGINAKALLHKPEINTDKHD